MMNWVQKQNIWVRLCFAFAYGGAFYAPLIFFGGAIANAVTWVLLTAFPFFYGTVMQLLFSPTNDRTAGWVFWVAASPIVLLCAALLIADLETIVCVAIIAPIFLGLMAAGMLVMRLLLARARGTADSETLKVSLAALPLLALPVLGQATLPTADIVVQTQITIAAPVDVVWRHTYEIPTIQDSERVWTFSHNVLGTPLPMDAVVIGNVRHLEWSEGIRFQEHLTEIVENTYVAWDFVFHAPETLNAIDPHISPQGDLVHMSSGAYSLVTQSNGDTLLTLETKYSITSPVNAYLSLWGEVFLQDFHRSVLSVIKARSEAAI